MRRRISRAQKFLAQPDLSISDIALRVGFSSQAHFTASFRKNRRRHASALASDPLIDVQAEITQGLVPRLMDTAMTIFERLQSGFIAH